MQKTSALFRGGGGFGGGQKKKKKIKKGTVTIRRRSRLCREVSNVISGILPRRFLDADNGDPVWTGSRGTEACMLVRAYVDIV
jgi:hypothetical protein